MARSQEFSVCLSAVLSCMLCFGIVRSCHSSSKALHICLNIYLERDFPLIETIVIGQESSRDGRVLLEGPDLENICRTIEILKDCYTTLLIECDTYWQLDRYLKLMDGITSTHSYLCGNSSDNVRDLLLNGACVRRAKQFICNCSHHGVSWSMTWKQIFRLQLSPHQCCRNLQDYRACFLKEMRKVYCGKEAGKVYGNLIDLWLQHWCSAAPRRSWSTLVILIALALLVIKDKLDA